MRTPVKPKGKSTARSTAILCGTVVDKHMDDKVQGDRLCPMFARDIPQYIHEAHDGKLLYEALTQRTCTWSNIHLHQMSAMCEIL